MLYPQRYLYKGSQGGQRLPFSVMLPPKPKSNVLAAAYPAAPTGTTNYPFPGYNANSYSFTPNAKDNSVWGSPTVNQFPDIPPDQAPYIPSTTNASENGQVPMLPGMENYQPQRVARSLWYRTVANNSDTTGQSDKATYGKVGDLFIYNTSYALDRFSTSALDPAVNPIINGTFNPNQPAPLILPETVCIDTADGSVDKTCSSTSGTLLNLNKPINTLFPSATNQPASSFTVCGATGASRRYQAVEQVGLVTLSATPVSVTSVTSGNTYIAGDITGSTATTGLPPTIGGAGTCPTSNSPVGDVRGAISAFYTGLQSFTTGQAVSLTAASSITATSPAKFTVNALSSTKPNVLDLTASNFTDLYKGEDANGNNTLDVGEDLNNNGILDRGSILTLNANGQNDPVFVLRAPDADVLIDGLSIKLNGVDPNKVFWTFHRKCAKALTIQGSTSFPTVLVGNFLGNILPANTTDGVDVNTGLNIGPTFGGKGVAIRSGRFLGFRAVTVKQASATGDNKGAIGVDSSAKITAMTTVNQPMVVPVLQVHAPITKTVATTSPYTTLPQPAQDFKKFSEGINGTITDTSSAADGNGQWTQSVSSATTEVNVYFVAGNTPSRSYVPYKTSATAGNAGLDIYTGETGGGLPNLIRFVESWRGKSLKISGGFIQNTRSAFATAPYSITAPYSTLSLTGCTGAITYATRATCIDTSSDVQTWFTNSAAPTDSLSNFSKYIQSVTAQSIPFFTPPTRLWGFDVGLLVQQPDLFAQRFSQALPNYNEFFRESTKDDPWVTTMLCALQPDPANLNTNNLATDLINVGKPQKFGTKAPNYTAYALGSSDRPSTCNTAAILPYNAVP